MITFFLQIERRHDEHCVLRPVTTHRLSHCTSGYRKLHKKRRCITRSSSYPYLCFASRPTPSRSIANSVFYFLWKCLQNTNLHSYSHFSPLFIFLFFPPEASSLPFAPGGGRRMPNATEGLWSSSSLKSRGCQRWCSLVFDCFCVCLFLLARLLFLRERLHKGRTEHSKRSTNDFDELYSARIRNSEPWRSFWFQRGGYRGPLLSQRRDLEHPSHPQPHLCR